MASVKLILNRHRALKSGAYPLVFQLIEFGVMIIAFKSALKSVLANPWAAIAIGAAMVAAAAVMTALINKNAAPDGRQRAEPANNPRRSIDCQGSGSGVCSRKRELQVGGVGWVIFLSLYLGNIIERPDTAVDTPSD